MNKSSKPTTIVLIPAYQPGVSLVASTISLLARGNTVVVVNDGSSEDYTGIFAQLDARVHVVSHGHNLGKGAALKTGYQYIKDTFSNYILVTADADGQHTAEDIQKVARQYASHHGELLLGSRTFEQSHVPLRSRLGNTITRKVFFMTTHVKVNDTQTGLRAFDSSLMELMLDVPGERFEYEMNVLLACARNEITITEVPITTIYETGNPTSHFKPIIDSMAIYGQILRFASSSVLAFLLDYTLFLLVLGLTKSWALASSVIIANIAARVISASFNFTVNKQFVFKHKGDLARSAVSYALLAAGILAGNTLVLMLFTHVLLIAPYIAKIITELIMFAVSYLVQKNFIFTAPRAKGAKR